MTSRQDELAIIVYAPVFQGDEGRALAIIHGMERALPGLRLEWTSSEKEDLIALPDRDAWVRANRTSSGFLFLSNDNDEHPVTIAAWENPSGLAAGSPPHVEVHVDLPLDTAGPDATTDVLEAIAEGAGALWGHATPFKAGVEIAEQTSPIVEGPPRPPRGLPALKLPEMLHSPEIPHRLGWLNYWSAATARAIGFPDQARDADLLSRARYTASGGWVVRLTNAPLDLDNPEHLATLLRTYERFPAIGGRSLP
ncbi:DUF5953 family protein [Myxococcus eversor]|uniref:DUF5953 family protein n=1 Tax=Myxococcus eversor TaxID=2709661 RepID=UPI0013D4AA93|nr:DUF5953 family protein [Myxococcus eversor]